MTPPLRLGTRGSALALAQAGQVAAALTERTGREVELVTVSTLGDTSKAALTQIGGAAIGTGSPRRAAQLRALGLGHDVVDVRGNVDTRLRLVSEGRLDAVVLA